MNFPIGAVFIFYLLRFKQLHHLPSPHQRRLQKQRLHPLLFLFSIPDNFLSSPPYLRFLISQFRNLNGNDHQCQNICIYCRRDFISWLLFSLSICFLQISISARSKLGNGEKQRYIFAPHIMFLIWRESTT